MKVSRETLQITWKIIRRSGYKHTRTPRTYCSYIAENKNHKHRLRVFEGTELFDILKNTVISKLPQYMYSVYVDGIYYNNNLLRVENPKKI